MMLPLLLPAEKPEIKWNVKTDTIYIVGSDTLCQREYDKMIRQEAFQRYIEAKAKEAGYKGDTEISKLRTEILKGNPEAIKFYINYILK